MFFLLTICGFLFGILSGVFGVGGGFLIVPLLISLGNTPILAIGTSSLAVFLLSTSATFHNWKQGHLEWKNLNYIAISCVLFTQGGVILSSRLPEATLLLLFGAFLIASIFLIKFRSQVQKNLKSVPRSSQNKKELMAVGGAGGFFAGMFGVGGGIVLVPLQTALLKVNLKTAIRNSLGIVMVGSLFASLGHAINGNVIVDKAFFLGIGGLLGAQVGTRLLPKCNESMVTNSFIFILLILAIYIFLKVWMLL